MSAGCLVCGRGVWPVGGAVHEVELDRDGVDTVGGCSDKDDWRLRIKGATG